MSITILRDDTALLAAAALLEATGAFDSVTLVTNPAEATSPAQDARAVAWLWRVGARQMDISDGVDVGGPIIDHGTEVLREVNFALRIGVREADPTARFKALCRLESVAYNAIQGTDLGGVVFPAFTLFLGCSDGLESVVPPEGRINLAGQFKYIILSVNRYDETDADA